jgi:UDP-N-acetylglucosamine 4,6-dehydratase
MPEHIALKNEKIFITGGAGYLGYQLINKLYSDNEITVYSRDENKHYFLKKKFPKVRCIIGDIRNYDLLNASMKGHTIGIFAASLKQIEAVDQNVEEAIQVIIHGAINSRKAAINNGLKAATFVSTDKAKNPTTLYGAMKFVASEAFIVNAEKEETKLSSVVFGNLMDSSGSIIPLIWDSIDHGYEVKLYGEHMTRFITDNECAVDSILWALKHTGYSIVPEIPAIKIKHIFEIYEKNFGLKWSLGEPRLSEKIHEHLFSAHEMSRVKVLEDRGRKYYLIHYRTVFNEINPATISLSSENAMSKEQFEKLLEKHNYYKPKTVKHSFPEVV